MATSYRVKSGLRGSAIMIDGSDIAGGSLTKNKGLVNMVRCALRNRKLWYANGVPAVDSDMKAGDLCLDLSNNDIYVYSSSAMTKLGD